jgi:hypothetical protein
VGNLVELAFADADLVPLLVAENYVNHRPDIVPPGNLALVSKATAWRMMRSFTQAVCIAAVGLHRVQAAHCKHLLVHILYFKQHGRYAFGAVLNSPFGCSCRLLWSLC